MKCPPEYWIWLQRTLGVGKKLDEIMTYFGDPVALYGAGHAEWLNSGIIKSSDVKKLVQYSPSQSYTIMKECDKQGWDIVTYDDLDYPARLRDILDFPCVLYVKGDRKILNAPVSIGMVGTRDSSDYGLRVAQELSFSLASAGAVIVSGGALGVDSASHTGALKAKGKTVAVLGCGLGCKYLMQNESLRDEISMHGAVISEFLPNTEPSRITFPVRNRIISGMTLGTVVIEAGEKSGSLITAQLAAEQGRDIFAVPGDITNSNYFGTNNLIRDGAKSVFSFMDVLEGYIASYGEFINTERLLKAEKTTFDTVKRSPVRVKKEKKKENEKQVQKQKTAAPTVTTEEKIKPEIPEYATFQAKKVFEYLSYEGILTDELVTKTGLPVNEVLSALTELEMYSLAYMGSGKRYFLN